MAEVDDKILAEILETLKRIEANTAATADVAEWFKDRIESQQRAMQSMMNMPKF